MVVPTTKPVEEIGNEPIGTKELLEEEKRLRQEGVAEEKQQVLMEFKELEWTLAAISSIPDEYKHLRKYESLETKFAYVFEQYRLQPVLLDPHLGLVFSKLIAIVSNAAYPVRCHRLAFSCLQSAIRARNFKRALRHLPHGTVDLMTAVKLHENLVKSASEDPFEQWEARFVTVLWLAQLALIPFDLSRFDSESHPSMRQHLIDLARSYLETADAIQECAAFMLARLLSRKDCVSTHLPGFVDWALDEKLSSFDPAKDLRQQDGIIGALRSLGLTIKFAARLDVLPLLPKIIRALVADPAVWEDTQATPANVRKLRIKILQRCGQKLLPKRSASWRYKAGRRVLSQTLPSTGEASQSVIAKRAKIVADAEGHDDGDQFTPPEEIEGVLDTLISSLQDPDMIVRWSAAKGIGRVSECLSRDSVRDIVSALLENLFSYRVMSGAWHGGCLTLAELARRGLLLPSDLGEVVTVVGSALHFDIQVGCYSLGSFVRDAACFVCWALARCYTAEDIRPHVPKLVGPLLCAMLFDREITVRRAASASFQENVGRQASFLHGIDIVTACDYFAVGKRTVAYLELAPFVAKLSPSDYAVPMIDHLVCDRLAHWDHEIRNLASRALVKIIPCSMEHFVDKRLTDMLTSLPACVDSNRISGVLLGLAECLAVLDSKGKALCVTHCPAIFESLKSEYSGQRGGQVRLGACHLVLALCNHASPEILTSPTADTLLDAWVSLLRECLLHPEVEIQDAAAAVTTPLFGKILTRKSNSVIAGGDTVGPTEVPVLDANNSAGTGFVKASELVAEDTGPSTSLVTITKHTIESQLKFWLQTAGGVAVEASRIGAIKVLGNLPTEVLTDNSDAVVTILVRVSILSAKDPKVIASWTSARAEGLSSLVATIEKLLVVHADKPNPHTKAHVVKAFNALIKGLSDYTQDARGDIGMEVRKNAIINLERLTFFLLKMEGDVGIDLLKTMPGQSETILAGLAQQTCEKAFTLCVLACRIMSELAHHQPALPVRDKGLLTAIQTCLGPPIILSVRLTSNVIAYQKVVNLLSCSTLRKPILLGLAVACGNMTQSVVKQATSALHSWMLANAVDNLALQTDIWTDLIAIANVNKTMRVIPPVLRTFDGLIACGMFEDALQAPDAGTTLVAPLVKLTCLGLAKSSNVQRIQSTADLLCTLYEAYHRESHLALKPIVSTLLSHRYPRVRQHTAAKFYQTLIIAEDIFGSQPWYKEVVELVDVTNWLGEDGVEGDEQSAPVSIPVSQEPQQFEENVQVLKKLLTV